MRQLISRKELYNIPGWHTNRHLIVIESDDWGSIRMPSREVYNKFLSQGIHVDRDPYCRYDALESAQDLSNLFEILMSVKDIHGHPAAITANAVTANPIFEKIKESHYQSYYYEPFTLTYQRDPLHANTFELWKQGMDTGVIHPQLHGREHLNVKKWLRTLQSGDPITLKSFDLGTFGLTQLVDDSIDEYYMGAFNSGLDEDITYYQQVLTEGQNLFNQIFGFKSRSFIATTYEWSPKIEPILCKLGISYIQGTTCQKIPLDDDQTVKYVWRGFQGTKTKAGLIRLMRNCFFEPSTKPGFDYVSDCLNRIRIAFKWGKAANICAHRVNFIGSIDPQNASRNLHEFKRLLNEIVHRWPDVEFITSDQLGDIIAHKK